MTIQEKEYREILTRLDTIMLELQALRRALVTQSPPSVSDETSVTEQLLASLGGDSLVDYDYDLDWERFES